MNSKDNPSFKDYYCSDHLSKIIRFPMTNLHVDNRNKIAKKCLGPQMVNNLVINNKRSQPKVSQHPADSNSDLGTIRTMNSKQFGEYKIYDFQGIGFDL